MVQSRLIAGILGPVLMATTATETVHLDIWSNAPAPLVYLNGMILFTAGVLVARTHWVWERSWRLLVTLTGCALMAVGFLRVLTATRSDRRRLGERSGIAVRRGQAAMIFSLVIGMASRKVCIGVFPKHQRP